MTIPSKERATAVEEIRCSNELGAMIPSALTSTSTRTRKSNQIVHDIRCHAIRVLGLSKIESLNKSTPKAPSHQGSKQEKLEMEKNPKPAAN
jgi:hypothetical protein